VWLVQQHVREYPSQWAAIGSIAEKIGCTQEALRRWVWQAERDAGLRPGLTTEEQQRVKHLERENRELRRANEADKTAVLTQCSAAGALDAVNQPSSFNQVRGEQMPYRTVRVFTLAACLIAPAARGQSPTEPDLRIWSVDLDAKARWFGITPGGLLWVTTEKGITAWKLDSGTSAWRRDGPFDYLRSVNGGVSLLVGPRGLISIDLETGKDRWGLDSLPLIEISGFFEAKGGVAVVVGPAGPMTFRMVGVDLSAGRVLWTNDSLAAGIEQKPKNVIFSGYQLALPDSSMLFRFARGDLVRVSSNTGSILWRLGPKPGFALGWPATSGLEVTAGIVSALPLYVGGRLFAASGILNVETGAAVWERPDKPKGYFTAFSPTTHGVLTVLMTDLTTRTLQLVDSLTGMALWASPQQVKGVGSHAVRNDTLFVAVDKGLVVIELATGRVMANFTLPDFANREEALRVTSASNGDVLMASSNNLMRVSLAGQVIFHRHYGRPSVGFRPLNTMVMPNERNPDGLVAVYTNDSDSLGQKGILFLDRESGEEIGTVRRKDRAPSYAIDALSRTAVGIDDRRLTGYRFAPLP